MNYKLIAILPALAMLAACSTVSKAAGTVMPKPEFNSQPAEFQVEDLISDTVYELLASGTTGQDGECEGRLAGVIVVALSDGRAPAELDVSGLPTVERNFISQAGGFPVLERAWLDYDVSGFDVINEAQSVCRLVYG